MRIKKLEKDEQVHRDKKMDLNNKQQMLINKINCLLRGCPDKVRDLTQHNVWKILRTHPKVKPTKDVTQNKNSESSTPTTDSPIIDSSFQKPSTSDRNRTTLTNISTNKTVVLTDEINRSLIAKTGLKTSPLIRPSSAKTSPSPSPGQNLITVPLQQSVQLQQSAQLQQSKTLPAGKFCKIIDGKIVVLDKPGPPISRKSPGIYPVKITTNVNPQNKTELLVPIAGLPSPVAVTVLSDAKKKPANVLCKLPSSILIKKSTPVVDLTDD